MDQNQLEPLDPCLEPSFYAIIPDPVMSDPNLPDSAKLLFGTITSLQKARGYCYATNRYLAQKICKEADTVSRLIKKLSDAGYLEMEIIRDPTGKEIIERRIYPIMGMYGNIGGYRKNFQDPPGQKSDTPPGQKSKERIEDSRIAVENPPKAPQRGKRSSRKEPKGAPDHNPERFARFWEVYPRGENKQKAIGAWDRLKPSDELCDRMAKALKRQLKSEDWQRGIGIPHASTWINQRRWEDEVKAQPVSESDTRGDLEQW